MQTDGARERGPQDRLSHFESLLGTVAGGPPLHHKASGRLRLGRRPILFGTVASRRRLRASGLCFVSMAMHTVVHQSEGTKPLDK